MEATAGRTIAAKPERVASVMFDPLRDPDWIGGLNQSSRQSVIRPQLAPE
jgi:hypothetical protein